jgi:hypothetical protein
MNNHSYITGSNWWIAVCKPTQSRTIASSHIYLTNPFIISSMPPSNGALPPQVQDFELFLRKPHSPGKNCKSARLSFVPGTVPLTFWFRNLIAERADCRAILRRARVDQPDFCRCSATLYGWGGVRHKGGFEFWLCTFWYLFLDMCGRTWEMLTIETFDFEECCLQW